MGEKIKRLKLVLKNTGIIFKRIGENAGKVMQQMEESEKKIMKNIPD